MISFFEQDPLDPEQSAHSNSMQLEYEPGAHNSTVSNVSPWRPCAIRQSDNFKLPKVVHLRLDTAELVNLVAVT